MTGRRHLSAQRRCAVLVERATDATRRVRAASRSDAGQKLRGARRRRSTLQNTPQIMGPKIAVFFDIFGKVGHFIFDDCYASSALLGGSGRPSWGLG